MTINKYITWNFDHYDVTDEITTEDGTIVTAVIHCGLGNNTNHGATDMTTPNDTWDFDQTIRRAREQAETMRLTVNQLANLLKQANKEIAALADRDQENLDKLNRILDEREKGRS